jgi:hypothetical protein
VERMAGGQDQRDQEDGPELGGGPRREEVRAESRPRLPGIVEVAAVATMTRNDVVSTPITGCSPCG